MIRQAGAAGMVLSIGFTGGVCLGISLFIGYKIDSYFSSEPWGIIGGIIIGLAAAVVQTWKQLRESMDRFAKEDDRSKEKNTKL
ncbi:MAG: AtpZ/AtpI family protein [Candidatus Riflebacteria bacterium]|nr:AtpZ/AtpI family protein [Candidatus Riflebacteria bacterium]